MDISAWLDVHAAEQGPEGTNRRAQMRDDKRTLAAQVVAEHSHNHHADRGPDENIAFQEVVRPLRLRGQLLPLLVRDLRDL